MLKNINKQCECTKGDESYYIAPAGCADDDAAVATLPDIWDPRRGGPILANYLKEREQKHQKTLQDIADGAREINKKVDAKIRALAEALLVHIKHNQSQICLVLGQYDKEDTALAKEERDEALKQIYQLHAQRIDEIANFKRETSVLERERSFGLKKLLRDHFQRLISVGHCPPKDLLHDFDERAYEINQQLLSNTRAYVDLEAQLRVRADDTVVQARSSINQYCLGISMKARGRSASTCVAHTKMSLQRPASAGPTKSATTSLAVILGQVEGIEAYVTRLVQAYRAGVMRVFTDFSDQLIDLEKDLGAHQFIPKKEPLARRLSDFSGIVDNTMCRLSTTIHTKHLPQEMMEVTGADTLTIRNSLLVLGECLQDTCDILNDAGHLWDAHILRQALAQRLAIASVEDLITSNDTIEMANEVAFNIALEQLLGSSDQEKVQLQYDAVMGMLDRTGETYRLHSEAELGRLEEFMNLPISLSNILLAEFKRFIEKYPRTVSQPPINYDSQGGVTPRISRMGNNLLQPLPRAILQTELQAIALNNWRNGFLESFESNVSLVPEELRRQARFWVEERANALHVRYSLKLVSHSIRVERIKAARESRLAELHHHDMRLESHLDALYEIVDGLPRDASEFASLTASYLYPFCDWVGRIRTGISDLDLELPNSEMKRLKLRSYAPRLLKHRKLYEESLDNVIELHKAQLEHQIQNVRISNVRFLSQIKLFNEGGRYSAQEVMRTCSQMAKGADALESCANRTLEALNQRRNQLLSQADQLILPLQRACEAVAPKVGGKAIPAKAVTSKAKAPTKAKK